MRLGTLVEVQLNGTKKDTDTDRTALDYLLSLGQVEATMKCVLKIQNGKLVLHLEGPVSAGE